MPVLLIVALRAAETLAAFHRQQAEKTTGDALAYHEAMARLCAEDAEIITHQLAAGGVTVEDQATAMRSRDLEAAFKIIERHQIMHGMGMSVEKVGQARLAMARDIADALAAERGGVAATWKGFAT